MKKIPLESKILSLSHNDMDGVGAQIILGAIYKNITYICIKYQEIDKVLSGMNCDEYDYVFLTDITPSKHELLDKFNNVIVIDHHENMENNPSKKVFINRKHSATKLVKHFMEKMYDVELSDYDDFVKYVNDYDTWTLKYKGAKRMNLLYTYYSEDKFRNRFKSGNMKLTDKEKNYILESEKKFVELYENLEIIEFEKINGCVFYHDEVINELAYRLMKEEGYKIVLINTTKNYNLSLRSSLDDFNFGKYLREKGWGGGHKQAAGIKCENEKELTEILIAIEKDLYKRIPSIRK